MEELQAFTSQHVPYPYWVKVDQITISAKTISHAATHLIEQLGAGGVEAVGGRQWWQWRPQGSELRAEWIEMRNDYDKRKANGEHGGRVMLYVHGGAYFFGSVDEHRYQLQRHARKLQARVFAPKYRLAPQFPFPCGLQDCLAAYLYLLTIQAPEEILFAADSAGAGMTLSMLVILRDQGLPLPAGAVLISPWVDLTHSFPSITRGSDLDYLSTRGFMHRPSIAWPPPSDEELAQLDKARNDRGSHRVQRTSATEMDKEAQVAPQERAEKSSEDSTMVIERSAANEIVRETESGRWIASERYISVMLDGEQVMLKEQVQLYTTNQLLCHPLVSPVLQPSLGGLPPLLILTGGGEVLCDEQIYLAHKAARPEKYPLSDDHRDKWDPDNEILKKYPPTNVQLQVWDDLCHVAPTLSFARPAKHMYRSIAQFGTWALKRAQRLACADTAGQGEMSEASSDLDVESSSSSKEDKLNSQLANTSYVGKPGEQLPPFEDHMIRQSIDRHGYIRPLVPTSQLSALQMPSYEIGTIKAGPVRDWLAAKTKWDLKYAATKRHVWQRRLANAQKGNPDLLSANERPPPSALVGWANNQEPEMSKKQSYGRWGLTMWSLGASRHDQLMAKTQRDRLATEQQEKRSP